jgi:hypothetical protein
MVADGQHVAAGIECQSRALDDAAERRRAGHAEIVGEHRAPEIELPAQHIGHPAPRQARRQAVDLLEDDVGQHHGRQVVGEHPSVRREVRIQIGIFASVDRQRHVRIRRHRAMAGKMLGGRGHTGLAHTGHERHGKITDRDRPAMERTVTDDLAHAVVEIDHRRERKIDAHRAQFAGQQPADLAGHGTAANGVGIVLTTDQAHRR